MQFGTEQDTQPQALARSVSVVPKQRSRRPLRVVLLSVILAAYLIYPRVVPEKSDDGAPGTLTVIPAAPEPEVPVVIPQNEPEPLQAVTVPEPSLSAHIETPEVVRALYVSGWMAGTRSGMQHIYNLIDGGKINAVVIDIKDATGRLSYQPQDPALQALGAGTKRIANLEALIEELHRRDIYMIGRLSAMQDPHLVAIKPEYAFNDTRTGEPWKDNKGLTWLRPDHVGVWEYLAKIARDAYVQGFDEINLDYVRFPSDGPLAYLDTSGMTKSRSEVMTDFFIYMDTELRGKSEIPLSADVFGLTTSATGDLGIGQIFEKIAPYVDYIAPMVYPSHYAPGSFGISDPASRPYEVITQAMKDGLAKLEQAGIDKGKMRPWLQDFDLGAVYTASMVEDQIRAAQELGIESWMMWDPANRYTAEVYR